MYEYDPGYGPLVSTRVRIATWNLWGRYGPWEARVPAIEATLRSLDPDICALQEVWEDDARSQAREIADALGFPNQIYAANLERDGARSGNAMVSAVADRAARDSAVAAAPWVRPATTRTRSAWSCSRRSTGRVARSRCTART